MENLDLYKCKICGNIIEVRISGGGELVCCGQPMEKLVSQTQEDAIREKHVPVFVKYDNNDGEIRIGEVLHPMINEHYIMFIQAISNDNKTILTKYLTPNEEPKFYLSKINSYSRAREFCNIHGLWEGNND